jgi:cell division protein FtsW
MLQKHLSCIIILGLIGLFVIIASAVNTKYISMFAAPGGVGVTCLALFTDYTKDRIRVWRDPAAYKLTGGWQTLQGMMAIGSGGLFGVGYGNSLMKNCYVSEPANDMIFAILCEELGLLGAIATLSLFAALVVRGYKIAMNLKGTFEKLVIFGICSKIAVQTLLNVAVVTNTIPNTGISLPFFSYGGSSLIMLFFEMGMILSFSRKSLLTKN